MTIDDQIKDEKFQYDINRAALLSGKIDKYEYLAGEEILPSNKKKIREQAKFTYSPLGKVFKEQTKEQAKAIKDLNTSDKRNKLKQIENIFPQNLLNDLVSDQIKKVLSYKTVLN